MEPEETYIKSFRTPDRYAIMKKHPPTFILLDYIAHHARREPDKILNLNIGEVFLGRDLVKDKLGLTESEYKTAKKNLEKWDIVTFKPTNKGTVAKLINNCIFDINLFQNDEPGDKQKTSKCRTGGEQATTNNKEKKEKKYKNNNSGKRKSISTRFSQNNCSIEEFLVEGKKQRLFSTTDTVKTKRVIDAYKSDYIIHYGVPL